MNDFINSNSYSKMCDYQYTPELEDLPSGLIHCDITYIKEFFSRIANNGRRYVVVSSSSDFGICYQAQFPVWLDATKAIQMFSRPEIGYEDLKLESRHSRGRCNPNDKYSVKMYSWTDSTFNEIPENVVHWFVTNCQIRNTRVSSIPFGVLNGEALEREKNKNILTPRTKGVYVNFQFYTNERAELYHFMQYAQQFNRITCERDVDYAQFVRALHEHKFCLCPVGNGIDCYRIWEAWYCGCVPIIEKTAGLEFLTTLGLPILVVDFLEIIGSTELSTSAIEPFTTESIQLTEWRRRIYEKVNQL